MKKLFLTFLVAFVATTALKASNTITYTATNKLSETANKDSSGLHTNAFNAAITSHEFSNGTGTITFNGDLTTIGDYAFYRCSGLTLITIPTSVTTIGNWAFHHCTGLTSITIPNSVITIGSYAFMQCWSLTKTNYIGSIADWCKIKFSDAVSNPMNYSHNFYINDVEVKNLVIPDGVDTIGSYVFAYCSGWNSITIPNSVTTIEEKAFYDCSGLTDIYCYAQIPPTCTNTNAFDGINEHCYIYVPVGTMRAYQFNKGWSRFYHFFEMSEVPVVGTDQVGVEVTNNTAVFSWPVNPTASSYTLVIKKNDEVFCTLTFNSLGQLVGMAFAPARGANNDSSAQSTAYGYSFMVSNLDASSTYDYTFMVKDASNNVLTTTTGQFKTGGTATDLETVDGSQCTNSPVHQFTKYVKNGRLLIERNGIRYDAHGAKVK